MKNHYICQFHDENEPWLYISDNREDLAEIDIYNEMSLYGLQPNKPFDIIENLTREDAMKKYPDFFPLVDDGDWHEQEAWGREDLSPLPPITWI